MIEMEFLDDYQIYFEYDYVQGEPISSKDKYTNIIILGISGFNYTEYVSKFHVKYFSIMFLSNILIEIE